MARIRIEQLASDVAALKGEALLPECEPEESPFPDMETRVRILAPGILAVLLKESDLSDIHTKNLPGSVTIDEEGVAGIPLPEDFLKLVCVRMSDWTRPVTHITGSEDADSYLQGSRISGIRGNPHRPVVITDYDASGKPMLKLYTTAKGSKLQTGLYIPRPVVSDNSIDVPDGLYPRLLKEISSAI
ncbi:MAG: hypothetical protein J1F12_00945 [Muribaculaceae bacterium]|nr:hypothetical protein [Muribaculaceae bacterium]